MSRNLLLTTVSVAGFTASIFLISSSIRPNTGYVITFDSTQHTYSLTTVLVKVPLSTIEGDPLAKPSFYYLNMHPQMAVWAILISTVIALSVALLPWLIFTLLDIRKNYELNGWKTAVILWIITIGTFLLVIGLDGGLGPYIVKPIDILHLDIILNPITLIFTLLFPILVALLGALVIFFVHVAFRNLSFDDTDFIGKSSALHKTFELISGLIAFVIALALFSNASLIETINKQLCRSCEFLPPEFGYTYGLIFTLFLASIYLPIAHNFNTRSRLYIGRQVGSITEDKRAEAEKSYTRKLNLESTTAGYLQVLFSTSAPLIGSILPEFLNLLRD